MRVLQFAPRICWPLDTGAKLRNYHLARVLAQRAQIALLAFTEQEQSSADLDEFYERVIRVRRDSDYTFSKVIRGALSRTPLPVLNYTTDAMKQTLARVLSEEDFDIVQLESIHLLAYLPIIRAARSRPIVVCDWHNIESELMRQYSAGEPNLLRSVYAQKTARKLGAFEQQAAHDFDAHILVSNSDRERVLRLNPAARAFVIENGVDISRYSDQQLEASHAVWLAQRESSAKVRRESPIDSRPHRIVFVGSMDYHANVAAVRDFAREVWPDLHRQKRELIFTIVGREPAAEVRELTSIPGIEVTGAVDDVRPYYREAAVAIVPLKVGGGSRLKILEAMAAGIPTVSTTLGAEGLEVRGGENILIADTKTQFLEATVSVVENEGLRRQLSAGGRALVSSRYDWLGLGTKLFDIYEELLNPRRGE